ncbi:hypothetical protein JT55_16635 [Rhodovulum sp. NI22]|nr:hypothetical protein JT55_16635 [Rhodovulum sp. NI22]
MKIDRIDIYHVSMPLLAPWKTAFSEEHAIESILVRMESDGTVGWGEAAPYSVPQFCAEWCPAAFLLIRDVFAPLLIGRDIASGVQLQGLLAPFKANQFAKAALDTAWWDLQARRAGQPLWQMLGGSAPLIEVGADIPVQDGIEALLARVAAAQEAGFTRTKLKFRRDSGVAMVARVRESFPDMPVHIDCNCGFTLDDLPLFRELDALGLVMIEQPLAGDDLVHHARLQGRLTTPLCLDESITSLERARKAIEIGACRWMNIKHGRVGGLTNALEVYQVCRESDVPCWIGGMLESNIGQGASIALATLSGLSYAPDIFPAGRLYHSDLATPDLVGVSASSIRASNLPGHGFQPVPEKLQAMTLQSAAAT